MSSIGRGIVIFLLGGILGTGFGVALGFFFFPYVFPPPPAAEQLTQADIGAAAPSVAPAQAAAATVATGTFIHAKPSDPVHWGRGKVSVYERTVFLEPDFEVGPGPAYHVYLVPNANVRDEAAIKDAMYVDLGRLRAFKGSQRYAIPASVDLKNYPSVVIWCERFGVLISPADLTPVR
ncbi:MAG: DM13 domain-containing protein [Pseudolabrys sp.]|nr:DM13 domain-containing protein [Pseudolabrys sp.]MDP2296060.1 DM13 domain-containing protein [Pseudolabrys sp.]